VSTGFVADASAVVALVAAALVIGLPVLGGGWFTYLDNPIHLAEIESMAASPTAHGWTDLAYCGFPITAFHSPLIYGLMGAAVRAGVPVAPLYTVAIFVGFVAPSVAVYLVTRRRLPRVAAFVLAIPMLVRTEAIWGFRAALGGMWPFALALGCIVLLIGELGAPPTGGMTRRMAVVASLVGVACLVHAFALVVVPVVLFTRVLAWLASPKRQARRLTLDLAAAGMGFLAAGAFWIPAWITRDWMHLAGDNAPARHVVEALVGLPATSPRMLLLAAPQVLLVCAAVAGLWLWRRREDDVPFLGGALALVLLAILLFWLPGTDGALLGTDSPRMLHVVRAALALAAVPCVSAVWTKIGRRREGAMAVVASCALLLLASACARELSPMVARASSREVAEARELWQWLREHRTESWGRVYLQDTFGARASSGALASSHLLARTAVETGVSQLGAYYGGFPPPTERLTVGEYGMIFGRRPSTAHDVDRIVRQLAATASTHLVLAEPRLRPLFADRPELVERWRSGRFTVLELVGTPPVYAAAGADDAVRVVARETGRVALEVDLRSTASQVVVAASYHPFWRVDGAAAATTSATPEGLLRIDGIGAGNRAIQLRFLPPSWPQGVSLCAWLAIAILWVRRLLGARVSPMWTLPRRPSTRSSSSTSSASAIGSSACVSASARPASARRSTSFAPSTRSS
jgi:hypothetical protein